MEEGNTYDYGVYHCVCVAVQIDMQHDGRDILESIGQEKLATRATASSWLRVSAAFVFSQTAGRDELGLIKEETAVRFGAARMPGSIRTRTSSTRMSDSSW